MATINLGRIKFAWQGTYSAATAYVVDDVVFHAGSSYICIANTTGNDPTNTTYWDVLSAGSNLNALPNLQQGDMAYFDGAAFARLPAGTSGQFLKTTGSGGAPVWTAVPQTVKEVFFGNWGHKNTGQNSAFFTHNFTPTQSGNALMMYTISYRMNSTNHMYAELFLNGVTQRYDGFNYPTSSHTHLQTGTAVVRGDAVAVNTQNSVTVLNRGGDTANSANDGPYGFSSTVWIV